MKNQIAKILVFLSLLISCGNVEENEESGDLVYIFCQINGEAVGVSRTILPAGIDLNDSSQNYCFYIWGSDAQTGSEVPPKKIAVNPTSSYTGTIPLDFPATCYDFFLAVTKDEASDASSGEKIIPNALFLGRTQADLRYNQNVKFFLTSDGLSGNGNAKVALRLADNFDLSRDFQNITGGIYKFDGTAVNFIYLSLDKNTKTLTTLNFTNIPAGEYNLCVKFSIKDTDKTFEYSDRIMVLPNQNIDSTLTIPNIIESPPASPSDFHIGYINSGMTDAHGQEYTETEEVCLLVMSWSDNSANESGFQISLAEIAESEVSRVPQTMTDSFWTNYAKNVKVFSADKESENYYGTQFAYYTPTYGSVEKNSTAIALWVSLGKYYIAKIESYNNGGISEPCYATFYNDVSVNLTVDGYVNYRTYNAKAFYSAAGAGQVANRYKIAYRLYGGTISYTENGSSVTKTEDFSEYHSIGETVQIIQPDSENSLKDGKKWKSWRENSVSGTAFSATQYTGGTSRYFFANYE